MKKSYLKKSTSPNQLLSMIYSKQCTSSKKRGHEPPGYSRHEFINQGLTNGTFWKLYREWTMNDYHKEFTPSCDRKDNTEGYSFKNIQFIQWKEHLIKTGIEHKKGLIVGKLKPVMQFTKDGEYINTFVSSYEAKRELNIHPQNIRRVCRGERLSAGGYKWEYTDGN